MAKIVIYGTGKIAELAHFYFKKDTRHQVVAFTNSRRFIKEKKFLNLPVVPFEEIEKKYPPKKFQLFVAIGYIKRNKIRAARFLDAKKKGYKLATYLSSKAIYFGEPPGENCFILENNVVQPFVKIGNNVTLWSGNHIGHHSEIGDHCFIASHVTVSGSCTIKENCFFGVSATLRDNISIGPRSVVGAGALVMENCPADSLLIGKKTKPVIVKKDVI